MNGGHSPDFAALFPGDPVGGGELDGGWQLSPRTAAVLHHTLSLLADDPTTTSNSTAATR